MFLVYLLFSITLQLKKRQKCRLVKLNALIAVMNIISMVDVFVSVIDIS